MSQIDVGMETVCEKMIKKGGRHLYKENIEPMQVLKDKELHALSALKRCSDFNDFEDHFNATEGISAIFGC